MSVIEAPAPPTFGELRTDEEKAVDAVCLARVKQGIAYLEETFGPDWVDKINLDTLDLSRGDACVLGQVYGHYHGKDLRFNVLGERGDWNEPDNGYPLATKYGFYEPSEDHHMTSTEAQLVYARLQAAWEHVLTPIVSRQR